MALTPQERRQIYEEEKKRIEIEAERDRVRKEIEAKQQTKKATHGALGCLGILVVLGFIGMLLNNSNGSAGTRSSRGETSTAGGGTSSSTPRSAPASKPSRGFVRTGEEGRLNNGSDKVILAADSDAFKKLTKASVANDKEGIALLILTGKVFMVPKGTRVRMLDPGILSSEVRILEGDEYGRSGIVAAEWVQP